MLERSGSHKQCKPRPLPGGITEGSQESFPTLPVSALTHHLTAAPSTTQIPMHLQAYQPTRPALRPTRPAHHPPRKAPPHLARPTCSFIILLAWDQSVRASAFAYVPAWHSAKGEACVMQAGSATHWRIPIGQEPRLLYQMNGGMVCKFIKPNAS